MGGGAIYDAVRRRTMVGLGLSINLHRFRGAAGTLWSILDPANVRGVKDLLGHANFGTTERHYIGARTRVAGRALAKALQLQKKLTRNHIVPAMRVGGCDNSSRRLGHQPTARSGVAIPYSAARPPRRNFVTLFDQSRFEDLSPNFWHSVELTHPKDRRVSNFDQFFE